MTAIDRLKSDYKDIKVSDALFHNRWYSYDEILSLLKKGKLHYISEKPLSRWTDYQKKCYLESLFLFTPLDSFIIDGLEKDWYIIVGENRLRSIEEIAKGTIGSINLSVPTNDDYELDTSTIDYLWKRKIQKPTFIPRHNYGWESFWQEQPIMVYRLS